MRIRALDGEDSVQERTFNLHDLTFRIDPVGNDGLGDLADYMNIITDGDTQIIITKTWEKKRIDYE